MKEELQNYQNRMASHQKSQAAQDLAGLNNLENSSSITQDTSRLIRSYGRIKSRKLSDHKSSLLENSLSNYEIFVEDFLAQDSSSSNNSEKILCESSQNLKNNSALNSFKKISFEIGFGFGDFLFAKAKSTPEQMFLGCEPHINGVVNLLAKLEEEPLANVKMSRQDARELLSKFDDGFFDEIYILFPDPWPKIKHFKRRLINVEFLDNLLAKKIKSGGKLIIATDHDSYKTWILSAISKSCKFKWEAACKDDWQKFPADWVVTKYQKKAAREGRVSVIFNLQKVLS